MIFLISLSLSVYSQETTIDYFGIYSDEHPTTLKFDKEIKLFIWERTGEMKELTYDQTDSKSKYMSFSYDSRQGWFGFGYAVIPNGKYFDISNFRNGYLHVNLKTNVKLAALKIGIKAGVNNEAWITNLSKYGFINDDQWHTLKIPVTDFAISDISKISQYFMLAGEGSNPGKIEFDEIFFQNKNVTASSSSKALYGLNFSPYLETQSPDNLSKISEEQIYFRLQIVEPFTQWIRTFSCGDGLEKTGKIAHSMGLNTLIGAWIGKDIRENDKQIEAIIKIAKAGDADIVAIGNEVLLRQDLRAEQLIKYIQQVKNELRKTNPEIKVTTVDGYYFLLTNPKLMEVCDVILINCYPFWDGVKIDDSIVALNKIYESVKKAAKGKEVIISETGWPSAGQTIKNAIPSKENARKYFKNVLDWATKHNIKCFYFSSFDESWKIPAEGMVGGYWGIFDNRGNMKYEIDNLKSLCLNTMKEGTTLPIEGIYIPSGYMGDTKTIQVNTITNTGNQKKILKISLSANSTPFWSGIYWQYPANNWGSQPGLKLYNPKRLIFNAKGESGSEIVEFKIGGISGDLSDSVNPAIDLSEGGTKLTNDWQQYTINLEDKDLNSVMGGFCCVASKENNPKGCVFYLSDIRFSW
jgi:exo-beta-1,3-glucanase (GH17 family)